MLNPDYRKTQLKDKDGKILLPQTTASMISEEPDRRFIDNVEKSFLNAMTVYREAIENLSEREETLLLLAANADSILPGTDAKEAVQIASENLQALRAIAANSEALIGLSNGVIQLPSITGEKVYTLSVDDSDGEPKLVFVEVKTETEETPEHTITDPEDNE